MEINWKRSKNERKIRKTRANEDGDGEYREWNNSWARLKRSHRLSKTIDLNYETLGKQKKTNDGYIGAIWNGRNDVIRISRCVNHLSVVVEWRKVFYTIYGRLQIVYLMYSFSTSHTIAQPY